jgi:hypothetical protein
MHAWVCLWVPTRRLAVRGGGSYLDDSRSTTMAGRHPAPTCITQAGCVKTPDRNDNEQCHCAIQRQFESSNRPACLPRINVARILATSGFSHSLQDVRTALPDQCDQQLAWCGSPVRIDWWWLIECPVVHDRHRNERVGFPPIAASTDLRRTPATQDTKPLFQKIILTRP